MIMKDYKADEGLQGNDKIEKAIAGLQKETTQEMLAHTLTVIRRRMKDAGQLIIAVEPPSGDGQLRLEAVSSNNLSISVKNVDLTLPPPFSSSSKLVNATHQFLPSSVLTASRRKRQINVFDGYR